ncbi:MAG: phosphoribosylformylglycinamidine cyclo-ligase [Neisseriaceae bacterium]
MKAFTYKDAGVDIQAGDNLVKAIKPFAKQTRRPEVLADLGGFGALFEIGQNYKNPVLVSSTDGVGTKLKLAFQWDGHDTVGIDLVAMSVNDILVQGAEPLFFLDYFACGKLEVDQAARVIRGIAKGCSLANCALIGGETAEMPDMYVPGEYDLAGFAVGVVEKEQLITGKDIEPTDIVLGLASSGAHSNGYSLIRKIITMVQPNLEEPWGPGKQNLKELLLAPTKIYVRSVLGTLKQVNCKGLVHITGGGLIENIPRILPEMVKVAIERKNWDLPPLFEWLQEYGQLSALELLRTFNCGIGMVVIVAKDEAKKATSLLQSFGETVYTLGEVLRRKADEEAVEFL